MTPYALLNRFLLYLLIGLMFSACASARKPVPAGVIPQQSTVYSEDEKYGHEVLSNLTKKYPLDRDDDRILRVRDIVDRLTRAVGAEKNPWHVYVLVGDDFKNAAATRGNYIFVWTGILRTAQNDAELATILSHEIAHVLAGHTAPDPAEETNRIIAGIAGIATSSVVAQQGLAGPISDLTELIVRASLEALLVNPDTQNKELEADQIGLFMMADAGYDPQDAINFWRRVESDPDFRGSPVEFLSSHPSSRKRVEQLSKLLEPAKERYAAAGLRPPAASTYLASERKNSYSYSGEYWEVLESSVQVFVEANLDSKILESFKKGIKVKVVAIRGRWLEISEPVSGYVQSRYLAPAS